MLVLIARLFGRNKKPRWPPDKPIGEVADEELMLMYGEGVVEAFEVLLSRHERGIFNFAYRSVGDRAKAEDLTQEVFLRVIKSAPKYKTSAKFTTWLYTIARNLCIDRARRKSGKHEVSLNRSISGEEGDGEKTFLSNLSDRKADAGNMRVLRKDFQARLLEALDALPEEQREVFVLREVEGMKFREIAEVVGVSENTIKSRMRYALSTLRGHLEEYRGYSFDADEKREVGSA